MTEIIKLFVHNTIIDQEKTLYSVYGDNIVSRRDRIIPRAVENYLNNVYKLYLSSDPNELSQNCDKDIEHKLFSLVNDKNSIVHLLEVIMNLTINIYQLIEGKLLCTENTQLYIHSIEIQLEYLLSTTDELISKLYHV